MRDRVLRVRPGRAPGGRCSEAGSAAGAGRSGAKTPEVKPTKVKVYKSAPDLKSATTAVEKRKVEMVQKRAVFAAPMAFAVNLNGQVQQMMMQFRPILRAEFHVIRVACQPTPEQRKAIAQAAEQTLRDATKKYVESMRRPMTMAQRAANEPRKLIEEGMVAALKSRISAEQAARYQAELTKRTAARKRLTLRNLVARLDHELILSPKQRDQIGESLSTHWDDSWGQSVEMFMNDNNYLPPIRDRVVAPFLNESQVKIWRSIPKYQGFFGGFGIMGGIMMNNDPLEDEDLREARLAAEAKEPQPAPMMNRVPLKVADEDESVREGRAEKVKARADRRADGFHNEGNPDELLVSLPDSANSRRVDRGDRRRRAGCPGAGRRGGGRGGAGRADARRCRVQ